jgi:hypothetical protein
VSIEAHASLQLVSREVGRTVRLYPHDQLIRLDRTDDKITVLIRRIKAREFRYQTCFDSAELWLAQWTRTESGYWQMCEPVTLPDHDFQPYRLQEIGEVRDTPEKYRARLEWEALCHRPGDGSRLGQRDSFYRSTDGSQGYVDAPMKSSWSEHEKVLFSSSSDD